MFTVWTVFAGMVEGIPKKIKGPTMGVLAVPLAGMYGPLSLTMEYSMLLIVRGVFPWLEKRADWLTPPTVSPVMMPWKARTGGLSPRRALTLWPVPLRLTGVPVLYPATVLTVPMRISDDRTPTTWGLKVAWKVKVPPAATVTGKVSMPLSEKSLASPRVTLTTCTPTFALQVIVCDAVGTPISEMPKSAPVQFNGKLTGAPKP